MKAAICRFDDGAHRSMIRRSINDVGEKPEIKGRIKGRRKEIAEKQTQGRDEERIEARRPVSSAFSTRKVFRLFHEVAYFREVGAFHLLQEL